MGNQLTSNATPLVSIENCLNELTNVHYVGLIGSSRFLKAAKVRNTEGCLTLKIFINQTNFSLVKYQEEINILKVKLENVPWCLPIYQTVIIDNNIAYLIRQFIKYNLYERMNTRPFLTYLDKKWLAYQILSAMNHLNVLKICHGDLKLENILVTSWNWILITDFACYKPVSLPDDNPSDFSFFFDTSRRRICYIAPERFISHLNQNIPNNANVKKFYASSYMSTFISSPSSVLIAKPHSFNFANPKNVANTEKCMEVSETLLSNDNLTNEEMLKIEYPTAVKSWPYPKKLTSEMDIFSVGCSLIELFTDGTPPFYLSQLLSYRKQEYYPNTSLDKIDEIVLKETLSSMISLDPKARPCAQECLKALTNSVYFPVSYTYCAKYINDMNSLVGDVKICRLKSDFLDSKKPIKEIDFAQSILLIRVIVSTIEIPYEARTVLEIKKSIAELQNGNSGFSGNSKFYDKHPQQATSSVPSSRTLDVLTPNIIFSYESAACCLKFETSYLHSLDLLVHFVKVSNSTNSSSHPDSWNAKKDLLILQELCFDGIFPLLIHLTTYAPKSDVLNYVTKNKSASKLIPNLTDKTRVKSLETLIQILSILLERDQVLKHLTTTNQEFNHKEIQDHIDLAMENSNFFIDYLIPKLNYAISPNSNLGKDTVVALKFAVVNNLDKLTALSTQFINNLKALTNWRDETTVSNQELDQSSEQAKTFTKSIFKKLERLELKHKNRFQDLIVHRLLDSDTSAMAPISHLDGGKINFGDTIPTTFISDLKRILFIKALPALCKFFGPDKSKEVLLSHAVTFLNDKQNADLRAQFFTSLQQIILPEGHTSNQADNEEKIVLPLIRQGLRDSEEVVIIMALKSFYNFLKSRLFQDFNSIQDGLLDFLPFLCHPNIRIRRGLCGCIYQIRNVIENVDLQFKILPLIQHHFTDINFDSEDSLFEGLNDHLPKSLYNYVLQNPKPIIFQSVQKLFCEDYMNYACSLDTLNKELFNNRLACIAFDHLSPTQHQNNLSDRFKSLYDIKFFILTQINENLSDSSIQATEVKDKILSLVMDDSNQISDLESNQVIAKLMAMGLRPGIDSEKLLCLRETFSKINEYLNPSSLHAQKSNNTKNERKNLLIPTIATYQSVEDTRTSSSTLNASSKATIKLNNEIRLTTSQNSTKPTVGQSFIAPVNLKNLNDFDLNLQPSLILLSPTQETIPELCDKDNFKIGKGPYIRSYNYPSINSIQALNSINFTDTYIQQSCLVNDNKSLFASNPAQISSPILPKNIATMDFNVNQINDEWQQMFGSAEEALQQLERQDILESSVFVSSPNISPSKYIEDDEDLVKIERTNNLNDYKIHATPTSSGDFHISIDQQNYNRSAREAANDVLKINRKPNVRGEDSFASIMARTETDLVAIPSACRIKFKKLLASKEFAESTKDLDFWNFSSSPGDSCAKFYGKSAGTDQKEHFKDVSNSMVVEYIASKYANTGLFKNIEADSQEKDDFYDNPVSHYILLSMIEDATVGNEKGDLNFTRSQQRLSSQTSHSKNLTVQSADKVGQNENTRYFSSANSSLKTPSSKISFKGHTSKIGPDNWKPMGYCVLELKNNNHAIKGPINQIKVCPSQNMFGCCVDGGRVSIWDPAYIYQHVPFKPLFEHTFDGYRCKSMAWLTDSSIVCGLNKGTLKHLKLENGNPTFPSDNVKVIDTFDCSSGLEGDAGNYLNVVEVITVNDKIFFSLLNTGQLLGFDLRLPMKKAQIVIQSESAALNSQSNPVFSTDHFKRKHQSSIPTSSTLNLLARSYIQSDDNFENTNLTFGDVSQEGPYTCMAYDADSYFLVTGSASGVHTCWDMRFRLPVSIIKHPNGTRIRHLFIHPSNPSKFYSCSSMDNEISLWDVYSASREKVCWASCAPPLSSDYNSSNPDIHTFNPLTNLNLSESIDPAVLNPLTRSPRQNFVCDALYSPNMSKDGYIISAGSDMTIRYWDLNEPNASYQLSSPRLRTPTKRFIDWRNSSFKTYSKMGYKSPVKYDMRFIDGVSTVIEEEVTSYEEPKIPCNYWLNASHGDTITSLGFCYSPSLKIGENLSFFTNEFSDHFYGKSPHLLKTYHNYLLNHFNDVNSMPYNFLISGSYDGSIRIWV